MTGCSKKNRHYTKVKQQENQKQKTPQSLTSRINQALTRVWRHAQTKLQM